MYRRWKARLREQVALGHEVHTVYEACGFGYTLHEELVEAGAQSLITTPMRLSPERRRKNDRLDARELCVRLARHLDGHRHELRPIGSYTGCCPGEHSSGGKRKMGSIDRMGNGRVRCLLVEAVWRFLLWQPQWKAAQKRRIKLAEGAEKTVVALARQLAVDLWRWRTGRATMEELGWVAA